MQTQTLALQPIPFKERRRTRGEGGVGWGLKSEFGALLWRYLALFGQTKAFQWRNSGIGLVFCCFAQKWDQL